jgi:hypothetical protein
VDPPLSLRQVRFTRDGAKWPRHRITEPEERLEHYLTEAGRILAAAGEGKRDCEGSVAGGLTADFEQLRWFPLPGEVLLRRG